jgi:glucose/arabinose dehydrogenase
MTSAQTWMRSIGLTVTLAFICVTFASCGSGGGGDSTPAPAAPPAGSATLTGTVSGTVIKVLNANTNAVLAQTDTASLPGPPPFPFSLSNIPVGVAVKAFFFSAGETFPFYSVNPSTNVFKITTAGTIDLGLVEMSGGRATAPNAQITNVTFEPEDPSPPPPSIVPPPATLNVPTSVSGTGSADVNFTVQDFSIGGEGQQHLHIRIGTGQTRHFFNGSTNAVKDQSGGIATDVEWLSQSSFRLKNLASGSYQVTVRLATASETEFVNQQAKPPAIAVTINDPPSNPQTLTIIDPAAGVPPFPSGQPINVSFTVDNFIIGGQGSPHMHISVDGGPTAHFYNGMTNSILDGSGNPVANMTWMSPTSFQITGLSSGLHQVDLGLVDASDQPLPNAEANPAPRTFNIQAPPGNPTLTVTSGTVFPSSPVRISFSVTDFTIGLPGTPHLRFSIDSGALHDFYNGPGINSDNGVLLNGVHDHAVHWTSTTSFDLFGLPAGQHQVRLVLVDASNTELPGTSVTHNFTVQQPPTGELQLEPVLSNLSFPVGLSLAPDGRIFYNERLTGAVRIINPGWQLDPTPFCELSVPINGEQGLLGLAVDPGFSPSNESVYVYYTAQGPVNRVSKLTRDSNGICDEIIIINNLPTSNNHNGGIIQFGPDGMLYIVIGDAEIPDNAQNLTSLAGKILRVNPANGSGLPGNPFFGSGNVNQDRVFSYGHRNSFGFTFHPQTGDLWESENGLSDFDEVNRVVAGKNYGWDSSLQSGFLNRLCCVNPILALPIIAPTGIITVPGNSTIYAPAYRNNLLMAAWNDGTIRLVIPNASDPDQPGSTTVAYPGGQGGLLSFMLGTDGYIYVTNGLFSGTFPFNSSSIFRVIPH